MLAQLSTVKSRLQILDTDTTHDSLLTSAIQAMSARFDKETNRTLARTENATQEFQSDDTEITVACYPIDTVTKFETKSFEAASASCILKGRELPSNRVKSYRDISTPMLSH